MTKPFFLCSSYSRLSSIFINKKRATTTNPMSTWKKIAVFLTSSYVLMMRFVCFGFLSPNFVSRIKIGHQHGLVTGSFVTQMKPKQLYFENQPSSRIHARSITRRLSQNEVMNTINVSSKSYELIQKWLPLKEMKSQLNNQNPIEPKSTIENILICGDGDLSFSASVIEELYELKLHHIKVTGTVLEEEETHNEVYKNSKKSTKIISSNFGRHDVRFGIDATKLKDSFGNTKFDRIQFNFPHWRGKCNNKYNRQLLRDFLKSASEILAEDGEIHVALCEKQGGTTCSSMVEWRQSWMAVEFAAECGLLLLDVSPFLACYNLSSHRGVDRGFRIGSQPEMYKFVKPAQCVSPKIMVPWEFQLCCRHELHVVLPSSSEISGERTNGYSEKEILREDFIANIIRTTLPEGITVKIPQYDVIETKSSDKIYRMAIFLVVYNGESTPITREEADKYREKTEIVVSSVIPLRANRMGRPVSKPFPSSLLEGLLDK